MCAIHHPWKEAWATVAALEKVQYAEKGFSLNARWRKIFSFLQIAGLARFNTNLTKHVVFEVYQWTFAPAQVWAKKEGKKKYFN